MRKIDPEIKKRKKYAYDREYQKNNTIRKLLQFHKIYDKDLIEYIQTIKNFNGYIKNLIKKDMENKKG